ncbi:lanthionine synthetase LanC family protein [Flavobacterium sp. SLB02]|uniref:lanthionine synthetase LanC family protein n=1 Tax=Flavobacterium sp. SLB02 TaxID=2665645 RepID=UPI001ABF97AA|nr:lanthionine synthetase LanC family protein [Flavobacterium sp. SLB02]
MEGAKKIVKEIDLQSSEFFESDGLLNGKAGLIYYYYCLYKHFGKEDILDKISINLELILKNIETQDSSLLFDSSLQNGLSGLGYILYLLTEGNIIDADFEDQIKVINEIVFADALKLIENRNYDFMGGPFGILFYLNFAKDKQHVNDLVGILYNEFEKNNEFTFYNETNYLEGVHIGYAHGICAIVKVLDEIEDTRCDIMIAKLLQKLITIINSNKVEINKKKYFLPRSIHKNEIYDGELNFRAVLAWSNCDVNFSTLIYSIKEKHVTQEALKLADMIALESLGKRHKDDTMVWDHRFFFGSSGVLQMYNYLYQKTNDDRYYHASKFWYDETLFFLSKNTVEENPLDFINNLPATALALLEFEESQSLGWSKILLL